MYRDCILSNELAYTTYILEKGHHPKENIRFQRLDLISKPNIHHAAQILLEA